MKNKSNKLNQYLPYFYLMLSFYIFVQATFFPQKPANFLINIFNPKLDSGVSVFSINDHLRYLTIVVYTGLAISGAFFCLALDKILSHWIDRTRIFNFIHLIITQSNLILGFLCGVKVYHLIRGDNPSFFSISNQTLITLVVLIICTSIYSFRKQRSGSQRSGSNLEK